MKLPAIRDLSSMRFHVRARQRPPGTAPGTLTEPPGAHATTLSLHVWGRDGVECSEPTDLDPVREAIAQDRNLWLNVTGLRNVEQLATIGELFGLHPLLVEDMLNTHQRPKQEIVGSSRFVVLRMAEPVTGVPLEQVSFVLRGNALLTVQERPGDAFEPVRERLRRGSGRMRTGGADWMLYALIDALVDGYYAPLERLGDELDELEELALDSPHPSQLVRIRTFKRMLLHYRRALWPMRETLSAIERSEGPALSDETRLHFRDCHDHCLQLLDLVETYREVTSGLLDIYLSSASHRMNEVMKVLTIMSTVFIPLTFIAGVYGMNFDPDASPWNLPELRWRWGYPGSLALMATVAAGLILWFRRLGWIGQPRPPGGP